MTRIIFIAAFFLASFGAIASARAGDPATGSTPEAAQAGIRHGVAFLVKHQNSDGSWGGPGEAVYTFTGDVWGNPETHHSWRVGTTGLCALALLRAGETPQDDAAAKKGIEYLIKDGNVLRPSEWDTMDCWAHIYGLQALAVAYADARFAAARDRIHPAAEQMIHRLEITQSPSGGWGYLEFDEPRTPRLQWATSFTTGAAIVALQEARAQGFKIDEKLIERAVNGVAHCRLPNGAYTYSIPVIPDPRHSEWIDQVKGSLSRIQVCNVALILSGRELPLERLRVGVAQFFREHRFLDIARNKPVPHETYYYNSGYFYLFGHYYAGLAIEHLPQAERPAARARLWREILKTQQADGSMWDYDMHRYHKPYGTAFGVLGLAAGLPPRTSEHAPAAAAPAARVTTSSPAANP